MARRIHRRRHHYRHHGRRIGAVRKSSTIADLGLMAVGVVGGGFLQSKFFTTVDPKIKGAVVAVIGALGMGSRKSSIQHLSAGIAASGIYNLGRGFNIIGALPAPIGLIPETLPSQQAQHVTAVGAPTSSGMTNLQYLAGAGLA